MTVKRTYRTKEETIKYFKNLAWHFEKQAYKGNKLIDPEAKGKAEAYELAAFELERNMK